MELTEYREHILRKIKWHMEDPLEKMLESIDELLVEYSDETNVKNLKEITQAKEYIVKMKFNVKSQQERVALLKTSITNIK